MAALWHRRFALHSSKTTWGEEAALPIGLTATGGFRFPKSDHEIDFLKLRTSMGKRESLEWRETRDKRQWGLATVFCDDREAGYPKSPVCRASAMATGFSVIPGA